MPAGLFFCWHLRQHLMSSVQAMQQLAQENAWNWRQAVWNL